ncbi:hypothetical protein PG994_007459 [Apiospora phragmitis]|uniref:Uncharacterized protein n=1 Tax=Apiospora phragmitis TaxID=2905665 RepID=A0ABR1V3C2_9PEZI
MVEFLASKDTPETSPRACADAVAMMGPGPGPRPGARGRGSRSPTPSTTSGPGSREGHPGLRKETQGWERLGRDPDEVRSEVEAVAREQYGRTSDTGLPCGHRRRTENRLDSLYIKNYGYV